LCRAEEARTVVMRRDNMLGIKMFLKKEEYGEVDVD
jgi:hypothetical protein